jgi:hypothetical protein
MELIDRLDEIIASGKPITEATRLKGAGRIISLTADSVEVRLNKKRKQPKSVVDEVAAE